MTIPPSESANTARAALVARLIELREAAGLTGNALAERMQVVQSRVWKIEHFKLWPKEKDLRLWAQATGHAEEDDDLVNALAEARKERLFSSEVAGNGLAAYQDSVRFVEDDYTRIGEFSVAAIPGLLQTGDYARGLFNMPSGAKAWGSDNAAIEDAVDSRLRRQEILHDPDRTIQIVVTEGVLRTLLVPPTVHALQLGKLLSVIRLPAVELGVIGFDQRLPALPFGFRVYGNDLVVVESLAGESNFTDKANRLQVVAYMEAFNELRQAASTGEAAEKIIQRSLDEVRRLI